MGRRKKNLKKSDKTEKKHWSDTSESEKEEEESTADLLLRAAEISDHVSGIPDRPKRSSRSGGLSSLDEIISKDVQQQVSPQRPKRGLVVGVSSTAPIKSSITAPIMSKDVQQPTPTKRGKRGGVGNDESGGGGRGTANINATSINVPRSISEDVVQPSSLGSIIEVITSHAT
jgi:hypothetical protein